MNKGKTVVAAAAISLSLVSFSGIVAAQEETADKNMNDYSCKDVMSFTVDNREIAIAFLHGYFLGKQATTEFNTDVLSKRADQFVDYCLDNPTAKALDSMARFSK